MNLEKNLFFYGSFGRLKDSLCQRQICLKYRVKREFGKSPFENGSKYCKRCGNAEEEGIYIKWEGLFCPCCGFKLRIKARHKRNPPKHVCIQCKSTVSIRGEFPLWFENKNGDDVCWKCWFKIHMVVCKECGKKGKLVLGKRNFVIKSKIEIRCKICHQANYYQNLKEKQKNITEKAIIPRFH